MMDDDEKTVRGGHGPPRALSPQVVRTTAPVGTPVDPAAPQRVPSDRPMSALTPPRTVGGHTARLNVPEGEAASPAALQNGPGGGRTVGGTMRMAPAPTLDDEGAIPGAPPSIPVTVSTPGEPGGSAARSPNAPGLQPAPATTKPAVPHAVAAVAAEAGDVVAFLSPIAVSVGLVFFAVGSMIALAADGRFGGRGREPGPAHVTEAPAAVTVTAAPAPPPKATATPVATAVLPAAPTAPTATVVAPPVPSPREPRTPPPLPSHTGTRTKQPPRPDLPF
jgi:hypothetical protein